VRLNLPLLDELGACENLLIAGMGGGFDVFCGLPLFPEWHLTRWFKAERGESVTVWCFGLTGARPLADNYRKLAEHLSLDGILLVDGGVDSLMHGDEAEPGTLLEDTISLAAVRQLDQVPLRLTCCIGLGAEQHLSHYRVFENIAELTQAGAFLGACSLTPQMEAYQAYESAVTYVHEKMKSDTSVINASVVSAVQGRYGDYHLSQKTRGSRLWISPLMPLYWFFELEEVCKRNLLVEPIASSVTMDDDALLIASSHLKSHRKTLVLPLK
jgi:hypothetical protein